jgi:hypothetical protein
MKYLLFLLVATILVSSCATTNKIAYESIQNAIIGQNEMIVCNRLGMPTRVEHVSDGGKVIIYEHYREDMYSIPIKPAITYNATKGIEGNKQLTFTSNVNTVANDPRHPIYPTNESYLKYTLTSKGML